MLLTLEAEVAECAALRVEETDVLRRGITERNKPRLRDARWV